MYSKRLPEGNFSTHFFPRLPSQSLRGVGALPLCSHIDLPSRPTGDQNPSFCFQNFDVFWMELPCLLINRPISLCKNPHFGSLELQPASTGLK